MCLHFNHLVSAFGIGLGDTVLRGSFEVDGHRVQVSSGAPIFAFPQDGFLLSAVFSDEGRLLLSAGKDQKCVNTAIAGGFQVIDDNGQQGGRIVVFGDSNCVDSVRGRPIASETPVGAVEGDCFHFLDTLTRYAVDGGVLPEPFSLLTHDYVAASGPPSMPGPVQQRVAAASNHAKYGESCSNLLIASTEQVSRQDDLEDLAASLLDRIPDLGEDALVAVDSDIDGLDADRPSHSVFSLFVCDSCLSRVASKGPLSRWQPWPG
eukprot:TRINITY_DN375_c0_g1_i4.p2 TRINITY_DN375_c0_g1~~TRINITY_DN375_c0_g1_i4.p2  ORF type:complete len:263 (-),score=43.75 TRINITY_DN375_c0_g1_i4:99-887(-)